MLVLEAAPDVGPRGVVVSGARALRFCRIAGGFILLWSVAEFAHILVALGHVPIPGNVVGLVLLLALLELRVVRVGWLEDAAGVLIGHMTLFFVPLAVGALAFGPLLAHSGVATLATLALSSALGIIAAGRTVAAVQHRRAR